MLELSMMSTEAYQAMDSIPNLDESDLHFLSDAIVKSSRNRSRICTHRSSAELLHEMFVIYGSDTFVRPNRHLGKDESVFVIRGACDTIFFDDAGNVTQVVSMGDQFSADAYFCRIPQGVYHTLIVRSAEIILFEGTPGPLNPAETEYAEWGPQENDIIGIAEYRAFLNKEIASLGGPPNGQVIPLVQLGELVYAASDAIVPFTRLESDFLLTQLHERSLDRVRICAHLSDSDRLHEMLMGFSNTTYVRPSLHVDKDESLFILAGFATYYFFDAAGNIVDAVPLGPLGSSRSFYCRIPANTYHTLVVESDTIVVKETTSGPFERSATEYAPWAPDGTDPSAAADYLAGLGEAWERLS